MNKSNIAYKAGNHSIITLKITGRTNEVARQHVNPEYAKYRTDKAYVMDIDNFLTGDPMDEDTSVYDRNFVYKVGEDVEVQDYDANLDETCATGIHYFKTRAAAEEWYRYVNMDHYTAHGIC
jgi:Family of unknown function (DUF5758)